MDQRRPRLGPKPADASSVSTTTGQPSPSERAIARVWRRATGQAPGRWLQQELARSGLTGDDITELSRLANAALREYPVKDRKFDLPLVAEDLFDWATFLLDNGMARPAVLGWLRMIAGAPGFPVATADDVLDVSFVIQSGWFDAVPADLAPWAWAAGLGVAETRERYLAGDLHLVKLRTLAGLRGHRVLAE